jgi:hypothetical protein
MSKRELRLSIGAADLEAIRAKRRREAEQAGGGVAAGPGVGVGFGGAGAVAGTGAEGTAGGETLKEQASELWNTIKNAINKESVTTPFTFVRLTNKECQRSHRLPRLHAAPLEAPIPRLLHPHPAAHRPRRHQEKDRQRRVPGSRGRPSGPRTLLFQREAVQYKGERDLERRKVFARVSSSSFLLTLVTHLPAETDKQGIQPDIRRRRPTRSRRRRRPRRHRWRQEKNQEQAAQHEPSPQIQTPETSQQDRRHRPGTLHRVHGASFKERLAVLL